jgi:hypothetical protein
MTVQLNWPPEVVERLTQEARQRGLSLDAYVLQAVLEQKRSNGYTGVVESEKDEAENDAAEKRRKREEAAASIRELRKGVTLGPDLTIRDLINEGRRF